MFKKVTPFLLLFFVASQAKAQFPVVDNKGTMYFMDSSKWMLHVNGDDIFNKNPGNTGIGISNPLYKLDVFSAANPLRLQGLTNGSALDSILVSQNGVIKKIASLSTYIINNSDSTTASNGLNLAGNDVRLGGFLTEATAINSNGNSLTIHTNGSAFNITGLANGASATDSLVTVSNGLIRKIAPINSFIINRPDSTTASNGLNLAGKDVRLGGILREPTMIINNSYPLTIATNGSAFNVTGLQSGLSAIDSLVTVQNGLIRKIAPIGTFITNRPDSTTARNGLNMVGKDVRLGGNLIQATSINNNGNAFTISTNGSAFNITGLANGASATDSLVTVSNGLIRKIAPVNSFITNRPDSTTASNGLNMTGKDVRLGGILTQPTSIITNGNTFGISGLPTGVSSTDSLVTVLNGTIRKIAPVSSLITNNPDSTTASNGLNLVGKDVRLGGNLTQATTVNNNTNALTFNTNGAAFNITGLANGASATDSLVTVSNGLIRKIAPINSFAVNRPDSTTASNGLNMVGKDVRLGGALIQPTTLTTNGNAFNITGLANGTSATDSLVTVSNGLIRKIAPINTFITNRPDSTTASNGLNMAGKDVRMGGTLIQPTTINTNGNSFNITGLPAGVIATDSLVTVLNGTIRKIAPLSSLVTNNPDSTTASNGLNLVGKDVRLGGTLTQATSINSNANTLTFNTNGSAFNITGLVNGTSATDSLVTVSNGLIRKIAPINSFTVNRPDSTTASNGLNLVGKDVRLGGNLTQTTSINSNANALTFNTNGSAFNITGLVNGTSATDSLVTVSNGLIRKIAPINSFTVNRPDSTTASNGLNMVGKDVRLGGVLTQPTSIITNGNSFGITGLPNGVSATDSLVTVLNGTIRKIAPLSSLVTNNPDSTTASNGLNLVGKDVRLGGNLTQATAVNSNANTLTFNTSGTAFNITGLPAGVSNTDSLVVVQNGLIRKIAPVTAFSNINRPDSTTASNGLNLVGKDVRLGGNLTQATTVTNNGNALTFATAGTPLNITGLPTAAITDSVVMVNNTNGQLRKMPVSELQEKLVEVYDAAGTQNLNGTFSNIVMATSTIVDAGYTLAAGQITVTRAGLYKIIFRASAESTGGGGGGSVGGEYRITLNGTAIAGTAGFTAHTGARPSNTVTIVKMMNLAAGSIIAGQGREYSGAGNLRMEPGGSSLIIERIR